MEFYYRLFQQINYRYIKILNKKQVLILSNQNYNNSVTSRRKLDNRAFNKLKIKEINLIDKLDYINRKFKLRVIFYWIIYKLFLLFSFKFDVKSRIID